LYLLQIKDKKFIVILTWVPLQTSCGKTYDYWMSDTMWPDLERIIVDKCARVAGKDTWDNNTLHAIKTTATVGNLDVA
jgi:hypothetical protein